MGTLSSAIIQIGFIMSRWPSPEEMRARILESTDRLFYERGIRATGVDTVAGEVGISKRTLYDYYPSKDELIAAYLSHRLVDLEITDRPPREQIRVRGARTPARQETVSRLPVRQRGCRGRRRSPRGQPPRRCVKERRRQWFRDLLERLGVGDADGLSMQLAILLDGATQPASSAAIRRSCDEAVHAQCNEQTRDPFLVHLLQSSSSGRTASSHSARIIRFWHSARSRLTFSDRISHFSCSKYLLPFETDVSRDPGSDHKNSSLPSLMARWIKAWFVSSFSGSPASISWRRSRPMNFARRYSIALSNLLCLDLPGPFLPVNSGRLAASDRPIHAQTNSSLKFCHGIPRRSHKSSRSGLRPQGWSSLGTGDASMLGAVLLRFFMRAPSE